MKEINSHLKDGLPDVAEVAVVRVDNSAGGINELAAREPGPSQQLEEMRLERGFPVSLTPDKQNRHTANNNKIKLGHNLT